MTKYRAVIRNKARDFEYFTDCYDTHSRAYCVGKLIATHADIIDKVQDEHTVEIETVETDEPVEDVS